MTKAQNRVLEIMQGASGTLSSKRLSGIILIIAGLIMGVVLFSYCLYNIPKDANTASEIIITFITAGSSLLGLGLFEKTDKKNVTDSTNSN